MLAPLKLAETIIQPDTVEIALAVKAALVVPCATVTVLGTAIAALLLVRPTAILPAAFDSPTVQEAPEPAGILVGVQAIEDKTGADHRVRLAVCDEAPSVAVTDPGESAVNLPAVTGNVTLALPAGITTVAGTVTSEELLRVTVVVPVAGCASVAVHEMVAPDIAPTGHAKDVRVGMPLVTVPLPPEREIRPPDDDEATVLLTPIVAVPMPAPTVRLMTATMPFAIAFVLIPEATQRYAPMAETQLSVLAAVAEAGPVVTEIDTMLAGA